MNRFRRHVRLIQACILVVLASVLQAGAIHADENVSADTLVIEAVHYYRGDASESILEMTIHRPDWERSMTMKVWTLGQDQSLVTILEPPKDKGNGTLKKGTTMWMFNPKINRAIKLPPSMMSQSWMGSDFSNNDLARSDSILNDYTHELLGSEIRDGVRVYTVRSTPRPQAPVVWGKIEMQIREDYILVEETFFDEEMEPVKTMTAADIQPMAGKPFPNVWTMRKSGTVNEYTRLVYRELEFKPDLPGSIFTLSGLKDAGR